MKASVSDATPSVIVRGEATGTPVRALLGLEPTGKSFRTMSIDIHSIEKGKIKRSYHVENWIVALRQLREE
jgi:predicted ester cyclase